MNYGERNNEKNKFKKEFFRQKVLPVKVLLEKSSSGKKGSSAKRAAKKRKRMIIFGVEAVLLLALIVGFLCDPAAGQRYKSLR